MTQRLRETWLGTHPWLQPVAQVEEAVARAVKASVPAPLTPPDWESWGDDAERGWPLLRSEVFAPLAATRLAECLGAAAARLRAATEDPGDAASELPRALKDECARLDAWLSTGPVARATAAQWVLSHGSPAEPPEPGIGAMLRLVGWTATQRLMEGISESLGSAKAGDAALWTHGHCPGCGALAATAQLVEVGGGRVRYLGCGLCGCTWRYRRVGCPHCGNEKPQKLEVLEVEGEPGLRLDTCHECRGYVKTDTRNGRQVLLRADWPTLHLDVLAAEWGWSRLGPALFEAT